MRPLCIGLILGIAALLVPGAGFSSTSIAEVVAAGTNRVTVSVAFEAPVVDEVHLDGRVYAQVRMDGCGPETGSGRPQVPVRGVWVAIPFGATPRLRLVETEAGGDLPPLRIAPAPRYVPHPGAETESLDPVFEEDASVYGAENPYPGRWVEMGGEATLRFQRVLQVSVYPLRWVPGAGAEWVRRVTFEVSWDDPIEPKGMEPAPAEPVWEAAYRKTIVNAESARPWLRSPAAPRAFKQTPARQDEFKLLPTETGLYEVLYEDLAGLDGPVPAEEVAVYQKIYAEGGAVPWEESPVPIHLVDENGDGQFGPGDRLYFWALSFQDAYVVYGFEDRYTQDNVYWFGRGTAGGSRMDSVGTWEGAAPETLRAFPEILHFEEDYYYNREPLGPDYDGIPPERDAEQWFWRPPTDHNGDAGIKIYDKDPATLFRIRARFLGGTPNSTHYVTAKISDGAGQTYVMGDSLPFFDFNEFIFDSGSSVPNTALTEGSNYFQYEGYRVSGGATSPRIGAYLDWVEVSYDRLLKAREDYLDFNSGESSGARAFRVDGFTGDSVLLFDVTDPARAKHVILPAGAVAPSGSGYRLAFADSLAPGKAGEARRWVAVTRDKAMRFASGRILKDSPSSLYESEGDYVIIAHPLFLEGIQPLAAHRESEGHRVRIADVNDVYDEFNGGIKDPLAIKRYLRWGFEHWTDRPQFALLVGDASEDHRGRLAASSPDFVPTISTITWSELAAMDNWYVRFDEDSYLLDVFLGRLSVGSESELSAVVNKILAYEQFSLTDTWRGRVVLLSDDQCSTIEYDCMRGGDAVFETASRDAAAMARASLGSPLNVVEIHLSEYTGYTYEDGYHASCYGPEVPVQDFKLCVQESVYAKVTPWLYQNLNQGALLFTLQGHGNRTTVFDEIVVGDGSSVGSIRRTDVASFTANSGRPYIVHGFGCHFADFDEVEETLPTVQESILEKMLLIPGKGAVAVLGSTALEAANTNGEYERQLYRALFESPPAPAEDGGAPAARWLLGEVQATSIAYLAASPPYDEAFLSRYVLLGDPGMRIDALPPAMRATVDGSPVENGGSILAGDSSSVRILVWAGDEVSIDSTSISVAIVEGGETTNLTAGQDFHLVRDTTGADGRVWLIDYTHEIRLADYDLVFGARDRNGLGVSFTLRVRFDFRAWFDGRVAVDGSRVLPGAQAVTEVTFPRKVTSGELTVRLAGAGGSQVLPAVTEPLNETGTRWRVSFSLEGIGPGLYDLVFAFGTVERVMMSFEIADRLRIDDLTAYPSPFEEDTGFSFALSRSARVTIRIFSVAGHRVRTLEQDGLVDFNYVPWDGRDEEGDSIANGVYLYQVTAEGGGEQVKSEIGRVVRMK